MYLFQNVMNGVIYVPARLRPIPEFTDTTDTNTLDLHRCRYQVPSTDTGSDVTAAMTSCFTLYCVSTEQACDEGVKH